VPLTGGRASGTEHSAHRPQRWSCRGPSMPPGPLGILQSGGDGAGRMGLWSCSKRSMHDGMAVADHRSAPMRVGPDQAARRHKDRDRISSRQNDPDGRSRIPRSAVPRTRRLTPPGNTPSGNVRQVDMAQTDRRGQRCRDEREPGGSHGHGGWPRSCAWEPAREAIPPVRW
jgi:hypothetical protein